jgi:hypothetical protein
MANLDLQPATLNVAYYRGDIRPITINVTENGVALDVSADAFIAQLRRDEDGELVTELEIDDTDADTGVLIVQPAEADVDDLSGTYKWDLRRTVNGATKPVTLVEGTYKVARDVSRAVTP